MARSAGKEGGREGGGAAQPRRRLPRPGQRLRGHRARRGGGAQVPPAAPPQGAATSCPGQPFPSSSSSLPSLLLRLFSDSKKLKSSSSPLSPPLRQGAAGGTRAPTHRHGRGAAGKRSEPCQILPMAAAAAPSSSFSGCASGKAPASPLRPHAAGREAPAAASLPAARCSPGFAPPGKGHPAAVPVWGVCACAGRRGGVTAEPSLPSASAPSSTPPLPPSLPPSRGHTQQPPPPSSQQPNMAAAAGGAATERRRSAGSRARGRRY